MSAAISVALGAASARALARRGFCGLMIVGTLLFSGNLYLHSLTNFHALHVITPWAA